MRKILAACRDGRLTVGELAARTEAAQRAKSADTLTRVIADLPGPARATAGSRRGTR